MTGKDRWRQKLLSAMAAGVPVTLPLSSFLLSMPSFFSLLFPIFLSLRFLSSRLLSLCSSLPVPSSGCCGFICSGICFLLVFFSFIIWLTHPADGPKFPIYPFEFSNLVLFIFMQHIRQHTCSLMLSVVIEATHTLITAHRQLAHLRGRRQFKISIL